MALRDWPLWSAATTDSEDRGAARRVDVRRVASPLGVSGHYGIGAFRSAHVVMRRYGVRSSL